MPEAGPVVNLGDLTVRWQRFRSLRDTGWLRIRPITLLLGRNNSGKTSVLAPLLLLKQSRQSRTGTNALMTRGELINLGSFSDIVFGHDRSTSIEFGIRWHSHPRPPEIRPVGAYQPGQLDLRFVEASDPAFVALAEYSVTDTYGRKMLARKMRDSRTSYSLAIPAASEFPGGDEDAASKREAAVLKRMRRAMMTDMPEDFLFTARRTRRAGMPTTEEEDDSSFPLPLPPRRVRAYNQIADFVAQDLDHLLDDLYFIGPLREPPRRVYELSGEMPTAVGTRGEFAPEILFFWRDVEPLWERLHGWLRRFRFGETLECRPFGDDAFALGVQQTSGAAPTSILDMGFGLSQVLPLIVQTLMPHRTNRLVVEQPEIHLNPALQSVLADLFVAYAQSGGSVIVETHSEHLLLRLRTLIATGKIKSEDVAVYFVSEEDGVSTVSSVAISEVGHIEPSDWPEGFFADGLRESFDLVAAQSRARKRSAG